MSLSIRKIDNDKIEDVKGVFRYEYKRIKI